MSSLCESDEDRAVGVATVACTRLVRRGPGDGMHEQTRRLNWGPTRSHSVRQTKEISCRTAASGSDEAIVSRDPAGHYKPAGEPRASGQDRNGVLRPQTARFLPFGATRGRGRTSLLAVYKRVLAKVTVEFLFEAVLGKTRRTEF
jgi:hypothetical protein